MARRRVSGRRAGKKSILRKVGFGLALVAVGLAGLTYSSEAMDRKVRSYPCFLKPFVNSHVKKKMDHIPFAHSGYRKLSRKAQDYYNYAGSGALAGLGLYGMGLCLDIGRGIKKYFAS